MRGLPADHVEETNHRQRDQKEQRPKGPHRLGVCCAWQGSWSGWNRVSGRESSKRSRDPQGPADQPWLALGRPLLKRRGRSWNFLLSNFVPYVCR